MQEAFVNLYWKIRRYYWKTKPKLRKVRYFFINHYNRIMGDITAFFEKRYWRAYSFVYGSTVRSYWKVRTRVVKWYWVVFNIYESIRVFGIRLFHKIKNADGYIHQGAVNAYWWGRRIWGKITEVWVRGYWAVKKSVFYYPFSKTYWFLHFQWNKRVKKTKN